MSAICGLFHRDGRPASEDVIAGMSRALAHRGVEGAGTWVGGAVGLAHRASHPTLEGVAERQPITHQVTGLTLIADARIDNRAELLRSLDVDRHASIGDAELILRSYERWGTECPRHLIGDFAFAIRDQRTDTVFCARDPMGVKPFYFFLSDWLFAFASEIKALLRCPGVPERIDDAQVALHVAGLHDDRTATLYAGIHRLPAAQTLIVHAAKASRLTYWDAADASDTRFSKDEEYIDAFRDVFETAVRARLRSSVPVGATLSGGLDSSSIVCMARSVRRVDHAEPLDTFSLVFPGHSGDDLRLIDERQYIERVVSGGGITPHYVRGDLLRPLDDAARILWHLDEAHFAPNLYLHWGMFSAARGAGVGVLLDGFDGDSVVSHGFGRLTSLMRAGQWAAFETEVRGFAASHARAPLRVLEHYGQPYLSGLARRGALVEWMRASTELTRRFGLSRPGTAWRHGVQPLLSSALGNARRWIGHTRTPAFGIVHPEFASRVAQALEREAEEATRDELRSEREMHLRGLSQPLYQLTLEMADKSARAFGVEPRYPFFDRRLIEFCVSVPEDRKFAGGWPRALFRRAMEGYLPREVQWRSSKGNLSPNFDRGMRAADSEGPGLPGATRTSPLAKYVDVAKLDETAASYRKGATRGWRNPEALVLFRAAILNEWLSGSWRNAGPGSLADVPAGRLAVHSSAVAEVPADDSRREPVVC
jgi:asparagine synthase (glutamine-hydrolysing)